jgi:class 3 adenylate cyclase
LPEAEDVQLDNDAVKLDATVLYADLAESTDLVKTFKWWFAAEVYKSNLVCACRIIRSNGGEITAFDDDRVMVAYIDDDRDTAAGRTALQINYVVKETINPKIKSRYPGATYVMRQAVGVDCSTVHAARTGIRGSNDLVWVGTAANYAAKMCSLRRGYPTYITADIFNNMHESMMYGGNPGQCMWQSCYWNEQDITVHRSTQMTCIG